MKLIVKFLVTLFIALPFFLLAQSQNIWYFGNMAGLDFNVNPPSPISSDLNALEGTATTCSNEGELLFYSDGATIWDRQHQVMPNGSGLAGGASSAQSALIIPLPGSCHIYYLFTTEDHTSDGGLAYSIIDMCLNGGLGDVMSTYKNILLENRTAENLTAVVHANGEDIWILSHKLGSNEFLVYLLTAAGLNTTPVKTAIGSSYPLDAHIGRIKSSHRGDKIVSVASFRNIYEMFDFNNTTGAITNSVDLRPIIGSGRFVYGIEFSPNDNLLYLSTFFVSSDLIQLDLQSLQQSNLQSITGNYHLGALQLGPDGKIYMARSDQAYVDVIHNPDVPGPGCNYDPGGQVLAPGTTSQLGFPNIIPYSLMPMIEAQNLLPMDTLICDDDSIQISLPTMIFCNATYLWEDGTTSAERAIYFPGLYHVTLNAYCGNFTDTMIVSQAQGPFVSIPDDTLCNGESLIPDAPVPDVQYLWSDNSSNTFFQPAYSGVHWLQVSNNCASFTDSFYVTILPFPLVAVSDSLLCYGDTIQIAIPIVDEEITWSDGETDNTIQITEDGQYWISLSNLCGTVIDTFTIQEKEKPDVHLADTVICDGRTLMLNAYYPESGYVWSDFSTESALVVSDPGVYWVVVSNACGSDSSSMILTTKNCEFNVVIPNVFSPNGDGINDFIRPVLSQEVTSYEFQIFDRWGNNVFSSHDPDESWDGRFKDKNCSTGVYTMILRCVSVDAVEKMLKGDITLLR